MNQLFTILASILLAEFALGQEPIPPREVKPEDKKAAPTQEPEKTEPKEELDVQKTGERIAENAQKAGERLKEKDPGVDTRKIQDEILKDIDALLKKAQEPPPPSPPMPSDMPPPKDGMPPPKDGMAPKSPMPKGGQGNMPPPTGNGSQGNERKKSRRERKPRGESPMRMSEPLAKADPKDMNPMPEKKDPQVGPEPKQKKDGKEGNNALKRENDKLADLYKDVWGHLPDRLRQEMDLYYRDQFMPRYSELLKQYYSALAEQRKKSGEGK